MKIADLVENMNLEVIAGKQVLDRDITGGYVSDLLSDVIANAENGNIWITLQIHLNIIPVASMKDISGIIIVNGRKPEAETLQKAEEEKIPILGTKLNAFKTAGKLYQLGIS